MNQDILKRKLRELKKFEIRTRFADAPPASDVRLVWDELFGKKSPKYTVDFLSGLSKQELKSIYDVFFAMVYFRYYSENGITFKGNYNAALLEELGLPYDAGELEIKSRFRELAKEHHPDTGGDNEKFIALMRIYRNLMEKNCE